jgi:hypothetical protein
MVSKQLERYHRLKAEGRCPKCGEYTTDSTHIICAECREYAAFKRRSFRQEGSCTQCGGERNDPRFKQCSICRLLNQSYRRANAQPTNPDVP